MDPRLLDHYNRELQFIREQGADFARQYPRIAARLGLDGTDCSDPYVERLLESFAFLAARVQLKLESRHPDFTRQLTEIVYPHFLCPVPACAIVELKPDFREDALHSGLVVPRHSTMRSQLGKGERTAVEMRTAHEVTLWPLQLTELRYFSGSGALGALGMKVPSSARAAIRVRLQVAGGATLRALPLQKLTFCIRAPDGITAALVEQLQANLAGVVARDAVATQDAAEALLPAASLSFGGLEDDQSLLPETAQGLSAFRLLQEYFALPERFLFFTVDGLRDCVARCRHDQLDLYLLLDRAQPQLENALSAEHLRLHCTPAINLFEKSLDRIHVGPHDTEFHLLPDRNRPLDYEVHSVLEAFGIAGEGDARVPVRPFYSARHLSARSGPDCFFSLQRRPRLLSQRQAATGVRTAHVGTETWMSLTSRNADGVLGEIRQLDVRALCTNRDLPLYLSLGKGRTDFQLDGAAPIESIRCIVGPSAPRPAPASGEAAWKLVSHLAMNQLTLADGEASAESLRELLTLYADPNNAATTRQVEGVREVSAVPAVHRIPGAGPVAFGRGLTVSVTLEDAAFEGTGIVLLGAVLDRMVSRLVSVNACTCLELRSVRRGLIKRWPVRFGTRQVL
jgi:type VI secretion system protein ImpG